MSFRSKRELLQQTAPRYQQATEHQKGVILNEFVAATGYARKYAIRLLNHPGMPRLKIERPRPRHYGQEVQEALHQAWRAANQICAKRLVPFLPTLIEALERHGHLQLRDEVRVQLLSLSPATADRLLRPYRAGSRGLSTTRAGTLLKKQIPLRTFQGWNETRPGFMEADLVAHCGTYTDGAYLSTLTLTDVATGWTECLPLLHHDQESVIQALDRTRQLLPFPLLGLDTDNGSEFINAEVLAYCQREQITFTRGRPRQSNDQCFVEQKNGAIVRQVVGYERFVGEAAYRQLTELYRALRLYVNVFQPSMKLQRKQRAGSHVHRTYDAAQTPLQRLSASGILDAEKMHELTRVAQALDPLRLLSQLERLQQALWQHAVAPTALQGSAETEPPLQFEVKRCAGEQLPDEVISAAAPARAKKRRRKYEKSGRPHDWRTRPDPFEGLWEQITAWLMANPERTGVSLFQELQALYPGRFRATQVRTLQRGLQKVRKRIILQFDDQWTEAEMLNGLPPAPVLRAAAVIAAL
jgi:cell fate (sporulation/competence/biofilm development) regulator YlbF (YheA/YmcA/DUF963 family)